MPSQKKSKTSKRKAYTSIRKGRKKPSTRREMVFQKVYDQIERKNADTDATIVASTFSGPTLLNGIAQGTTPGNHIGRRATMKSLLIRYTADPVAGGGGSVSQVRFIVVYDKQTNAAAPAVGDIVQTTAFTSPLNLQNKDRFVCLIDEISDVMPSAAQNISGQRYMKMNLPVCFNGSTLATVAAIQTGAVWIIVANNADPAVTANSNFNFSSRIRFTDE